MIATVFGGSKTLLEELKIGEIPRILIKSDECSIELESIDSKRISIKVLKE
jgi:predicted regulator of Ras-like GTPase activity (Roadblock/LC7/MglB family)